MYATYRSLPRSAYGASPYGSSSYGSSQYGSSPYGSSYDAPRQSSGPFASSGSGSVFGFNLFGNLDGKAIKHVRSVYLNLFTAILAMCGGVYVWMAYEFNLMIAVFGLFASCMMLYSTSHVPEDDNVLQKRRFLMCLCGFFKGLVIAPVVEANLFTALGCTSLIFGSLTLAAFTAKRREYFFLGGLLGSACSILCFVSFINMFAGSSQIFTAQIYIGLLVFIGYVLFNTQVMLEKAITSTYPDPVMDAFGLFTDFVAILVRISIILQRNSNNNRRKRRE